MYLNKFPRIFHTEVAFNRTLYRISKLTCDTKEDGKEDHSKENHVHPPQNDPRSYRSQLPQLQTRFPKTAFNRFIRRNRRHELAFPKPASYQIAPESVAQTIKRANKTLSIPAIRASTKRNGNQVNIKKLEAMG